MTRANFVVVGVFSVFVGVVVVVVVGVVEVVGVVVFGGCHGVD